MKTRIETLWDRRLSLTLEVKCVETGLNFSLQIDDVPDYNRVGLGGDANPLGVRPAGETRSRGLNGSELALLKPSRTE